MLKNYWSGTYIDLKTQQLRQRVKTAYRRLDSSKIFALHDLLFYQHNDGFWYQVKMAAWRDGTNTSDGFLQIRRYASGWKVRGQLLAKYGCSPAGEVWYCTHKASANHKEIIQIKKRYGLKG